MMLYLQLTSSPTLANSLALLLTFITRIKTNIILLTSLVFPQFVGHPAAAIQTYVTGAMASRISSNLLLEYDPSYRGC